MAMQPAVKDEAIQDGTSNLNTLTGVTVAFKSLYKKGNVVNCSFQYSSLSNISANSTIAWLPEGFKPKAFQVTSQIVDVDNSHVNESRRITVFPNGNVQLSGALSSALHLYFSASWIVD